MIICGGLLGRKMVDIKPSAILVGVLVIIIGILIFKYADDILSISSGAGQAFSIIFFVVVFYFVFRFFRGNN